MDLEIIAKAFATVAEARAKTEPRYIAQIDDGRWIGYNGSVKTRASAMRRFDSAKPEDWRRGFPYHEYGYEYDNPEHVAEAISRITIYTIKPRGNK